MWADDAFDPLTALTWRQPQESSPVVPPKQEPNQHETAPDAAIARDRSQEMPLRRGDRRRGLTDSGRVQKKRASTRHGQEYRILRLGDVRRREGKQMEWKVMWAPTWSPLEDLRGRQTFEEAKELAVG